MLFKLQNFVFSAVFLVALNLSAQEIPPHSYRGKILSLANSTVREIAIRPDGRYLFHAGTGNAWSVLDLQDMVTASSKPVQVDGNILGLSYEDRNNLPDRLLVMTTKGVEYFEVDKVFAPEEETNSYVRPDDSTRPLDACRADSGQIFFLEVDSEDRHIVRVVGADKTEILPKVEWRFIFAGSDPAPDEVVPLGLRCGKDGALILGYEFGDEEDELGQVFLGYLPASNPSSPLSRLHISSGLIDYKWKDLIVDPRGEKALLLFNHIDPENQEDDAKAVEINIANLGNRREMNVGSGGQAVASFLRGSQLFYSFFVQKDILGETPGELPELQVLQLLGTAFGSSNPDFGERGSGSNQLGLRDLESVGELALSKWVGSAQDAYVYGLVESTGVSLFTNAPRLELAEPAENLELSESRPIRFKIRSDEDVNLEIRFTEDRDLEGEATGVRTNWGREIVPQSLGKPGLELSANEVKEIVITREDLGVEKNRDQSFVIFARRKQSPASFPTARLGIPFSFDPPPPAVTNFQLGYGDRSIHVFFDLASDPGDLDKYLIYVSEDPSDLENLPNDDEELKTTWKNRSIRGYGGKEIRVPVEVRAASWGGSYIIEPLENGRRLYVRVQVRDSKGNLNSNSPAAKSEAPRATKSLVSAFGSNSCALGTHSDDQASFWLILLGSIFLVFWIRRRLAG